MAGKENPNERVERIISVLGLSDEPILAEVRETGATGEDGAERKSLLLRETSQALENMNRRLSSLGHTINSNWRRRGWGYQNRCLNCGSLVGYTTANGEMQGRALDELCSGVESTSSPVRDRPAK
jgi:hypothetical protein